jgi:Flp pilus assembly protein TadG
MRRPHPSRHPGQNRRGQTLVMFALLLPLLLGMVGLAIDSGLLLATYRQTQNAADSAALAAAVDLFNSKTTATAQATGTSYVQTYNHMSGATVTINIPPLSGPHISGTANSSSYAEALVSYPYQTSFIQLLGVNKSQTVTARAVAGYDTAPTSGVVALWQLPLNGILAGISVVGGASLKVNGGILDNSIDPLIAMVVNNGGSITATTVAVAGGVLGSSSVTNYNAGGANPLTQNTGVDFADPLASLPVPTTSNGVLANYYSATATGGGSPVTITPASSPQVVNIGNGNSAALLPGIYTAISVQGGSTVTFAPGIYVLAGGGLTIGNGAVVSGSGVMFYNTSVLYNPVTGADGLLGLGILGLNVGAFNLGGGVNFNLSGITSGPFAGMLMFQDRLNPAQLNLNNGSSSPTTNSTYYAPMANLNIQGGATYDSPFVVGSVTIGNGVQVNITPPNGSLPYANLVFMVE